MLNKYFLSILPYNRLLCISFYRPIDTLHNLPHSLDSFLNYIRYRYLQNNCFRTMYIPYHKLNMYSMCASGKYKVSLFYNFVYDWFSLYKHLPYKYFRFWYNHFDNCPAYAWLYYPIDTENNYRRLDTRSGYIPYINFAHKNYR